jgi:predicted DCC family thiol-disulfide oxidoreductase YuxK
MFVAPLLELFENAQKSQNAYIRFAIFRVYFAILSIILLSLSSGFQPTGILSVILDGKWPWMLFKIIHLIALLSILIGFKTHLMQWINLCLLIMIWPISSSHLSSSSLSSEIYFGLFSLSIISLNLPLSAKRSVDALVKKVKKYSSNRPMPISILLIFSLFQMTFQQGLIDQIVLTGLSKFTFYASALIFTCLLPTMIATWSWLILISLNLLLLMSTSMKGIHLQSLVWINFAYLLLWMPDLSSKAIPSSKTTPSKTTPSKITLFYDGDCGVCSLAARCVQALDALNLIEIDGSTQNDYPKNHYQSREDFEETRQKTIIVWDQSTDQIDLKHLAFAQIFFRLQGFYLLGLICQWSNRIGEWAYDQFAQRRHLVSYYLGMGYCGIGGGKNKAQIEQLSLFEQTLVYLGWLIIEIIGIWSLI